MKKNNIAMVLGIIFGVSLAYVAYAYFAIGFGLALTGKPLLLYSCYVFAGLVITTIVGSALARKCIVATRVLLTISVVFFVVCIVYSLINFVLISGFSSNLLIQYVLQFVILALGVVAMVFAYLAKPKQKATIQ